MGRKASRWHAEISYKTQKGPMRISIQLIEIEELKRIMDAGPHWNCVSEITIVRENLRGNKYVTIDAAAKL
jgi:hypothetical protein